MDLVTSELRKYLPSHPLYKPVDHYNVPVSKVDSYGTCASAPNSSAVLLSIVYYYIRLLGSSGLKLSSELAIRNANYIKTQLENDYEIPFTK